MRSRVFLFLAVLWLAAGNAYSFELEDPECVAPAKPGGGHDIMCRLLATSLAESLLVDMSIRYMPGGIGALAYNHAVNVRKKDANLVVAEHGQRRAV